MARAEDCRQFELALWGACVGWLASMVLLYVFLRYHPADPNDQDFRVTATVSSYEVAEKVFFSALFALGPLCAFVAVRWPFVARVVGAPRWPAVALFVPIVCRCMALRFTGRSSRNWFFLSVLCLALPVIVPPVLAWVAQRRRANLEAAAAGARQGVLARYGADLAAVLLLFLLLVPSSYRAVAIRIGANCHPVSFFYGPALYCFGDHLIPGQDYFTQYGIGLGYVFSFFVGDNARITQVHYIWLSVALCLAFYTTAYLVIRRYLLPPAWAFGAVFASMLAMFHFEMTFVDPSSWPIRFPLLCCFIWLMTWAASAPWSLGRYFLAGACAGLSVYWNTETGLSMLGCGAFTCIVLRWSGGRIWRGPSVLVGATFVSFLAASLLSYGPGIFSWGFLWGFYKPFLVYGGGFGAVKINWNSAWNYWYAILSPLVALATIGWSAVRAPQAQEPRRRQELTCLLLFSLLGIGFLLKWVNRSFDSLWLINAFPLIAVIAWWLRQGIAQLATVPASSPAASTSNGNVHWLLQPLAVSALVLVVGTFFWFVQDKRNPCLYGIRALWAYPSLAKAMVWRQHLSHHWPAGVAEAPPIDVELIQQRTTPSERVAVISESDWVYLMAAKRVPRFHFVPSIYTFLEKNMEDSLRGADLIFIEIDQKGAPTVAVADTLARAGLAPLEEKGFELEATGETLAAYRLRKNPHRSSVAAAKRVPAAP
jgi:hypothetical protein